MNYYLPLKIMQLLEKNKIGFVLPWYGQNIPGGAEAEALGLIDNLKSHFDVEVLTTCVKDFFSDWNENFWKEGTYFENGVKIMRLKVDKKDRFDFHNVNRLLMNGKRPDLDEEKIYMRGQVSSRGLNSFIKTNVLNYKYFFSMPYMFGTTVDLSLIAPEKTVLIPCLHNEAYARMEVYKTMFSSVFRVFFHMNSEKRLAESLYGNNDSFRIIGEALDLNVSGNKERFFLKYGVRDFFVYVGRKDEGKNVPLLVHWFSKYRDLSGKDVKLLLIGPGELNLPLPSGIVDLGFITRQDKFDAIFASLGLINLSLNESFSLVLMEAGLLKRPVIVHENSEVLMEHVHKGNMGLFASDFFEFFEVLNYIWENKEFSSRLGLNGYNYVLNNFSKERVLKNILSNL
jgi:glycosyltransferase involved in cell wall biosynthesis